MILLSLRKNQITGVIVLIALVLLYVPVPLIESRTIASVALLGTALYLLLVK